ncbi:MAG: adenylate/guanylate cyclase domain-containing protein [Candidatus Eremiobacteraeota bacterium]|nr:adenylate/guanylate cyclase domain-containing protein [Candidatus Eremiobacteraeota bacterium]MBC5802352.1 adenylate/guanylate cyclase domain-containing protein [Candidatus Eremiobacteraeota bacterium]MBC5822734.1 adenylate/guanylate cyclase domain-containing protein [Candidatus Eremiobacteraeota bacterium]
MTAPSDVPGALAGVLPTGTLTFLFSDIEGSTQRWERDRSAMQEAVRRHDTLVRRAIGVNGGYVFKTIGDAFCAVFARAQEALKAALEAQRMLRAEDFSSVDGVRVRMALHTGTADERDNDYFGPAVNRVARLLAIGHGGQVLVSGVTADLAQADMPAGATLYDLGAHRLKDLARPERVYQLLAPELQRDFPALRSLDVLPNNLPPQVSSFIGRKAEVAEIMALIATHRVVTLTGSGGVGKTRTSLQVSANLLDGRADGVWFVELAPLADPALVPTTIASTLGLTLPASAEPLPELVAALRPKHCLLILDNCEHLVDAAAAAVSAILRGCPQVAIIASSRQALDVAGEQTYRLPSLPLPSEAEAEALTAEQAGAYSAIVLFGERARAMDERFTLTDQTAPIVADICRRLDGIPLAIELAAARVTTLGPRQLRERLGERFRMLTGGRRDALPRQQTLRALVDWSYELLDHRERQLFRRLGIFANGFTLEGAIAVGNDEALDEFQIFDVLASLVDKSLVVAEVSGETARYHLLESTRAYACEKLSDDGEQGNIAARHLHYVHDVFVRVGAAFDMRPQESDVVKLAVELDDARAALGWAAANDCAHVGGELFVATTLWWLLGLRREGLDIAERYAQLVAGDASLMARTLSLLAIMALNVGQNARAMHAAERALSFARASNDPPTLAETLLRCSGVWVFSGRAAQAEAARVEAEAVAPSTPRRRRISLEQRAHQMQTTGDLAGAAQLFEQLYVLNRSLGNDQANDLSSLADLEHARGDTMRAIGHAREALETLAAPNHPAKPELLVNLIGYLLAAGALADAAQAGRAALTFLGKSDADGIYAAIAVEHVALATALGGEYRCAARLAGYADTRIAAAGCERGYTETSTHGRLRALLRDRLSPTERDALLPEGAAWTADEAITEALRACSTGANELGSRTG